MGTCPCCGTKARTNLTSTMQPAAPHWCPTLGEGQLRSLAPHPWGCPRCSRALPSPWVRGQQAERLRNAPCPLPRSLGCRRRSARAADGLGSAPGAPLSIKLRRSSPGARPSPVVALCTWDFLATWACGTWGCPGMGRSPPPQHDAGSSPSPPAPLAAAGAVSCPASHQHLSPPAAALNPPALGSQSPGSVRTPTELSASPEPPSTAPGTAAQPQGPINP